MSGYARRPSFRLVIYPPAPSTARSPLDQISLDREITTIRYRNAVPGGFVSLEIGTQSIHHETGRRFTHLPRSAVTAPHCRGQLWEGGSLVFEGRLSAGDGPGGRYGLHFSGYGLVGLLDDYISSSDATSDTSGDILSSVLSLAAPTIGAGGQPYWVDAGVAHTLAEFNYRTPQAVVDQLSHEGGVGGDTNTTWDWAVYDNRDAWFVPRTPPAMPRYLIPYDEPPWMEWTESYDNMYSSAAVVYTLAGTETITSTATTPGFIARWGFTRTQLLTMGEATAVAAEQYRDTWLDQHAEPEYAIVLTRNFERGLELPGGLEYPAHLVRAGEPDGWVKIGQGRPDDPVLPIVGVEVDANSGETRIELGAPAVYDLSENLSEVCRETSNMNSFIHPRTGTRLRV